ncbi:MAG: flagellar biosynthetic protein FliO [Candidatus Eisenbacteria bacterium]
MNGALRRIGGPASRTTGPILRAARWGTCGGGWLCLLNGPAFADALASSPAPFAPSTGAMLVRVALALALVLGLLYAVLHLYRKAARSGGKAAGQHEIQIVSQRSLGPRTSLALVRIAGESLLIGVTPQQITALGKVVAAQAESAGEAVRIAPVPAPDELPTPFESTLQGEIQRVGAQLSALFATSPAATGPRRREG